ncbi:MAG: AzlC family ABC transporter permease [Rhizobiaceae bacterium]|nr:AzlC family ABC transporter permease [Rhizobiaceae bacterium]
MSPIALFIIPFGMAFGVAAVENGMSIMQATLMSILVFSAAAQFASLELWSSSSLISLLLVVLAVSARHILLGASLSPWINQLSRPKRLSALTMLSDPNFADSLSAFQKDERDIGRLVGGGLVLWIPWIIGTIIGAVVGEQLGDLDHFGIDVLMPCYFAALILAQWIDQWEGKETILPAITAIIVAIVGLEIFPIGWNVVAAAIAGGIVGGFCHGR